MKKKILYNAALVVLFLTLTPFGFAAEKANTESPYYEIKSNAKDLSLIQGQSILPYKSGIQVKGRVGINQITVTAPGFGTRRIRFWLKSAEKKSVEINLARLRREGFTPDWQSSDRFIPRDKLEKLPSICTWYHETSHDLQVCPRESWNDDRAFAEPSLFHAGDFKILAGDKEDLKKYRFLVNQVNRLDPETTRAVEEFYAQHSDLTSAFQLAAVHNLIRGDCPRVHEIMIDAQQTLEVLQPFYIYKGMCAEMQGQLGAAQGILQEGLSLRGKRPPVLYYELGRVILKRNPSRSLHLSVQCNKAYPNDVACQELGIMAARLDNKVYKFSSLSNEEAAFKALLSLEAYLPKKQFAKSLETILDGIQDYPQSLEYYLFMSWLNADEEILGGNSYLSEKMKVATIMSGPVLDTIIDTIEKNGLTQLLAPVYRNKLSHNKNDPATWLRLVRSHFLANQCVDALRVMQEAFEILPKYNPSLLQIQANCYVQENKPANARDVYLKLIEISSPNWETFRNLAMVFEQLRNTKESINYYEKALENNPPQDIRLLIQNRLTELKAQKQKRPKKMQ